MLVYDGDTWSVVNDIVEEPKAVITLDPDGANEVVFKLEGDVLVESSGSNWRVWAQDDTSGDVFETEYKPPFSELTQVASCESHCDHPTVPECSCSNTNGACVCFCGIFTGWPYCWPIINILGEMAPLP